MKHTSKVAYAACGLALCATHGRGDVVQLGSVRDNTLYENPVGSLSNGQGEVMFAGRTAGGTTRRALIRFDLSGIPAGSTITAVTLALHMSKSIVGDVPVELRRALVDWGEGGSNAGLPGGGGTIAAPGDATWIHTFSPALTWSAPGGAAGVDYAAAASSVTPVGAAIAFYTWPSTPTLVSDAQSWVNSPANNFGWFIFGDETTTSTAKRFDTRENVTSSMRPVLSITFTPPCYADCDAVGGLTANDFQCFLDAFVAGASKANCDGVGGLTANDFQCFLDKFVAGCS